jgi:hypothetical protein
LATFPDTALLDPIHELGEPMYDGGGGAVRLDEPAGGEQQRLPCRWGDLPGTLLFEPRFGTSGLFVARIRKMGEEDKEEEGMQ